jgi:hypothetical protein
MAQVGRSTSPIFIILLNEPHQPNVIMRCAPRAISFSRVKTAIGAPTAGPAIKKDPEDSFSGMSISLLLKRKCCDPPLFLANLNPASASAGFIRSKPVEGISGSPLSLQGLIIISELLIRHIILLKEQISYCEGIKKERLQVLSCSLI